jgi:hypothetical protein
MAYRRHRREVFNSDAYDDYHTTGNGGAIEAQWEAPDNMPATARITIPGEFAARVCVPIG